MNHNEGMNNGGWMNGWNGGHDWAGGGMLIPTVIGILVIILLVVAIIKFSKK